MKNIFFILCFYLTLSGCVQTTALVPSFIGSGGNIYKTSLSYGGNYIIKKDTGKSSAEHVIAIVNQNKNKKISKKKFTELVKNHIENSIKKINN